MNLCQKFEALLTGPVNPGTIVELISGVKLFLPHIEECLTCQATGEKNEDALLKMCLFLATMNDSLNNAFDAGIIDATFLEEEETS